MKIGYGKLGRSMPLNPAKWGTVGGDDEPPQLLKTLARRHPEHTFVLVGINSGEDPSDPAVDLPPNVVNPWTVLRPLIRDLLRDVTDPYEGVRIFDKYVVGPLFYDLDHVIVWAGQHGNNNTPIPKVGSTWPDVAATQDSFFRYCSYMIRGINAYRSSDPLNREEVWVNADPRNYLKARDLAWPNRHPILTQYDFTRTMKHERYDDTRSPEELGFGDVAKWTDGRLWASHQSNVYSRLEICGALPNLVDARYTQDWSERKRFGLFINEARAYVQHARRPIMRDWVMPLEPDFVHGKWPPGHEADLGRKIEPAPHEAYYPTLRSVRTTFTTPSSGSGWATTKPWQAFATGTVCFFHPRYDDQDHVLGESPWLREFLRVNSADELRKKVEHMNTSEGDWLAVTREQRGLYDRACTELKHVKMIEKRLGLGENP